MSEMNYWQRMNRRRLSRRTMLSASAKAGVGAAGLALVGCGDDDDDSAAPAPAAAATPAPAEQAQAQAEAPAEEAAAEEQAAAADEPAAAEEQAAAEEAAPAEEEQAVAAGPVAGGTISGHDRGDIASFDGFLTFGYRAFLHGHMVYPMLTQFENIPGEPTTFQPELWLAESIEQPDAQTYTAAIRPQANWENVAPTNGRPVTSEDVKFAYDGDRYAAYPNRGTILPHLDGMETPDDKTITFSLNKVFAPFTLYLGHHAGPYIMPPELVLDEASRNTMVGSGPFTLANGGRYEVGSRVVYKKNPDYWFGNKPYADEVVVNFVGDDAAIAAAYISGEMNATNQPVSKPVKDQIENAVPDGQFVSFVDNVIGGLSVDLKLEPFNDPRVRQALSNAMDRDSQLALTDDLEGGTWSGPLPVLPPWNLDTKDPSGPLYEFLAKDLTRANQLLDAAGVVPGDVPPLNFAVPAVAVYGNSFNQASLIYQQNFADLGFDFKLDVREATEHYSTTFRGTGNDGGASMTRSVQVIEPDEAFANMYVGDSPRSPIINGEEIFKDSKFSELLDAQRAAPDLEARIEVINELQVHLINQMYILPLGISTIWNFARAEIQDYAPLASFAPAPVLEDMWFAT